MGRGYVTMRKINENQDYVWYSFETPVFEEGIVDYSKGSYEKYKGVFMAMGYCKFNKHTAKFEVDEEKTDPYFIKEKDWIGAVHYILSRHFKEGKGYPPVTGYAA